MEGSDMSGDGNERNIAYDHELAASIKSLYDLTTRIDERVEQVIASDREIARKLEVEVEKARDLLSKVLILEKTTDQTADIDVLEKQIHSLELRMQSIEISSGKVENRWKAMVNFGLQLAWVIIAAYLLYKLGIQAPNTP